MVDDVFPMPHVVGMVAIRMVKHLFQAIGWQIPQVNVEEMLTLLDVSGSKDRYAFVRCPLQDIVRHDWQRSPTYTYVAETPYRTTSRLLASASDGTLSWTWLKNATRPSPIT